MKRWVLWSLVLGMHALQASTPVFCADFSLSSGTSHILRIGSPTGGGNRSTDGRLEGSAGQSVTGTSGPKLISGIQALTNKPPSALALDPAAGSQTDDPSPTFSWTYEDGEGNSQLQFQAQISADDFVTLEANTGVIASSATSFEPSNNLPVERYLWRVRLFDGFDWSAQQTLTSFFTIGAPAGPPPVVVVVPPPNPITGEGGDAFDEDSPQLVAVPAEILDARDEDLYEALKQNQINKVFYELRNEVGVLIQVGEIPSRKGMRLTDFTLDLENLLDAYYKLRVVTVYDSGEESADTLYYFTIDTISPIITVLNPLDDSILGIGEEKPDLRAGIFDATAGVDPASIKITLDTEETLELAVEHVYDEELRPPRTGSSGIVTHDAYASPFSEGLPDGLTSVKITARDFVGNETVQIWQFLVDRSTPTGTVVINEGDADTYRTLVTLRLESLWGNKEAPTTEIKIRNDDLNFAATAWQPYNPDEGLFFMNKKWVLNEEAGVRTVYIRYRDAAGNESSDTVIKDSINLSITYPDTYITSGPSGIVEENDAAFTYLSTRSDSLFSIKLDNQPWSVWSSLASVTFEDLAPGNHYFQVKAGKDVDLNTLIDPNEEDPIPATRSWVIGSKVAPQEDTKKPFRFLRRE